MPSTVMHGQITCIQGAPLSPTANSAYNVPPVQSRIKLLARHRAIFPNSLHEAGTGRSNQAS